MESNRRLEVSEEDELRTGVWHTLVEGHHVKNNRGVPTHVKRGQHQWMPGPFQPTPRGGHHVKNGKVSHC